MTVREQAISAIDAQAALLPDGAKRVAQDGVGSEPLAEQGQESLSRAQALADRVAGLLFYFATRPG